MEQKIGIVTGSSSGIGKIMAKKLVEEGYYVILACRNREKANLVLESFVNKGTKKPCAEVMLLDLDSFESIQQFVKEFHAKKYPLHLLINNAGIQMGNLPLEKTKDGFEKTFQSNHLGHFLLTNLLLDDLKKSGPSRIVIVSSKLHIPGKGSGPPPKFLWTIDEINDPYQFNSLVAYKNSKLANVWFGYELNRKLQKENAPVTVNIVCPGLVPTTGLFSNSSYVVQIFLRWIMYWFSFSRTEDTAASNVIFVATSPTLDGVSGKFYSDKQECTSSEESYDKKKAKTLWELSELWTGLKLM
jgi:light-dependent protochlorophyllide reductase